MVMEKPYRGFWTPFYIRLVFNMEAFLLGLFYLARPMMSTDVGISISGLNFFEALTILFTFVLAIIAIVTAFRGGVRISLSGTEYWMLVFTLWATLLSIFYYEISDLKTYVKWVLPLVTFIILKRAIRTDKQFKNLVGLMLIGYLIPITLSTVLIAKGVQIGSEVYWTGLERYHGAYATIHDMGHNMTLLFVSMTIFILVSRSVSAKRKKSIIITRNILFAFMGVMAAYCLYKAQVRTAYIGIFIFIVVFLYFYSKKSLVLFGGVFVASLIFFGAIYYTIFFDVVESFKGERAASEAGSGRLEIWAHNWDVYMSLPLHRKITGVGIGNKLGTATWIDPDTRERAYDSHNDWFQVFMATGPIGLIFMIGVFVSLFKSILRIPGQERYAYMAFFISVVVMNAASNSYFTRFPLAQMFYMLMVYAELTRHKSEGLVVEHENEKPARVIYRRTERNNNQYV